MTVLDTPNERRRRNCYILAGLIGMVVAMNGLAFAMVPAYRAFCQQFGFAGTPLVKETLPEASAVVDRPITVRFDSNIDPSLHWRFKPVQRSVELKVGE
ncbi:MAG: cytochrome c oxidase assembly protein, partial [Alphaproteobacteria bacterium]